jgi:hypothetical protein
MKKVSIMVFCLFCVILAGAGFGQDFDYRASYNKNGFPHIEAGSEFDALYGQGYEMTKSQGYLLYHIYIKAVGKWAKYYHPGPDPDRVQETGKQSLPGCVCQPGSWSHGENRRGQGLFRESGLAGAWGMREHDEAVVPHDRGEGSE